MGTETMAISEGDHDVQLTLPGEVEAVRSRLTEALERLGYKVLDEHPLTARRGAQGWAGMGCSFDALDYPTKLTVSLRQLNDFAVLATFGYEIKHTTIMTSGDRRTLEREAEALAALATERVAVSACPACGTQVTDDSRFCRRCGAPLAAEVAELEVLRLTRGARATLQRLAMGAILLLIAMLTSFLFIWVNSPKGIKGLWVLISMFAAMGLTVLFQATWRLHFTLNPREVKNERAVASQRSITAPQAAAAAALPPRPQGHASVTEGTTELLTPELNERVAVPVNRQSRDTGPIN